MARTPVIVGGDLRVKRAPLPDICLTNISQFMDESHELGALRYVTLFKD